MAFVHTIPVEQAAGDVRAMYERTQGPSATLAPADVAMMAFAEKLARDAGTITEADVRAPREHGFTDAEIFDIAATAAARCFFSKLLDALGAEPDAAYDDLDDGLKRRLTPGRAISRNAAEHVPGVPQLR
jgi:alkylhydroperoxidase/carboxymuconolactone decarboxylase family protein YurZ